MCEQRRKDRTITKAEPRYRVRLLLRCRVDSAMVMVTAAAAVRFSIHHFVDTFVQSLFQVGDSILKLAGCQALIAGGAGRVGFLNQLKGW